MLSGLASQLASAARRLPSSPGLESANEARKGRQACQGAWKDSLARLFDVAPAQDGDRPGGMRLNRVDQLVLGKGMKLQVDRRQLGEGVVALFPKRWVDQGVGLSLSLFLGMNELKEQLVRAHGRLDRRNPGGRGGCQSRRRGGLAPIARSRSNRARKQRRRGPDSRPRQSLRLHRARRRNRRAASTNGSRSLEQNARHSRRAGSRRARRVGWGGRSPRGDDHALESGEAGIVRDVDREPSWEAEARRVGEIVGRAGIRRISWSGTLAPRSSWTQAVASGCWWIAEW